MITKETTVWCDGCETEFLQFGGDYGIRNAYNEAVRLYKWNKFSGKIYCPSCSRILHGKLLDMVKGV